MEVMGVVGGALLSASLESLFEILSSQDFLKFARKNRVDEELRKWEFKLLHIRSVLDYAEEKQVSDQAVKLWLTKLRDLAYDAEDILDGFHTEASQTQFKGAESQPSTSILQKLLPTCCINLKPSGLRRNMRMLSKLQEITARLEEVENDEKTLNLGTKARGRSSGVNASVPTTSLVEESKIYGREKDKEVVVELLMLAETSGSPYSVIPIIGMGGMGKTTLAQLIYNDKRVESFDCKAWVCVSDDFDILKITKATLQHWESCGGDNLNLLQESLKKKLQGKKFLIVLDDVWNENYELWTALRSPFAAGAPGSKIIVTTRSEVVSRLMGSVPGHALKELSDDDCLSLLAQHALNARNFDTNPDLKRIGQEIVQRCKGLPLAAKTLGGLLRGKQGPEEWEVILHSKIWDLRQDQSNILPALRLSYHYLPSHLKQCFAFCAVFPKDHEFDKNQLVLLWMAEGFVPQSKESRRAQDLGNGYFDDLLLRSFFQQSSGNKSQYVMHDLISDLAQFVSGGACFHLDDKPNDVKSHAHVRHSSYVSRICDIWQRFEVFHEMNSLRTFLALPNHLTCSHLSSKVLYELVPKLKCLRALSLASYSLEVVPESIGGLKHLRYLNLSWNPITKLPQSLSKLFNLQTLQLRGCYKLVELPRDIGSLRNLQYLDISDTISLQEMPLQISELTSLFSLSKFIVGEGGGLGIGGLMKLSHLQGPLHVKNLHNVANVQDAKLANLTEKRGLCELTLEWKLNFNALRNETDELQVLNLLQPHQGVEKLLIESYGGVVFPSWFDGPSLTKMVWLQLNNCQKITSLPSIGKFLALETLIIEGLLKWEQWSPGIDEDVAEDFPKLVVLTLRNCPKLIGKLPSSLPSLKELHVHRCQEAVLRCAADVPSLTTISISEISELASLDGTLLRQATVALADLKVENCKNLKYLWQDGTDLNNLATLKRIEIRECEQLASLIEGEAGLLPRNLQNLKITACKNLEKLPNGLHCLTSLKELVIRDCPKLVSFPGGAGLPCTLRCLEIKWCHSLKSLPDGMMYGNNCNNQCLLEEFDICGCSSLKSFPQGKLPTTLKSLTIWDCENLESFPDGILCSGGDPSELSPPSSSSSCHSQLETLTIKCGRRNLLLTSCPTGQFPHVGISQFNSFPTALQFPTALKTLNIRCYYNIETTLPTVQGLSHLTVLKLFGCDVLEESFPLPPNLIKLFLQFCVKLKCLPNSPDNLTSLQFLFIEGCRSLVSLPTSGLPPNLTRLGISNCPKLLKISEWRLHTLTSLENLEIGGSYSTRDVESFPDEANGRPPLLPTSLTSLEISYHENLKSISKGIMHLTSLHTLCIRECPKLKFLPKEGFPATLGCLSITGCPILEPQCKKENGYYWSIIAHIPAIFIF